MSTRETFTAFTSTKKANQELLDVVTIHEGDDWTTALGQLRMHLIRLFEGFQSEGRTVTFAPIDYLGIVSATRSTFIFNAYGYYVGITTGGLGQADAWVQRELELDHQRVIVAKALARALKEQHFMPDQAFTEDDISVDKDEIRIMRRSDRPPFIGTDE